jgi:hypothetical protein
MRGVSRPRTKSAKRLLARGRLIWDSRDGTAARGPTPGIPYIRYVPEYVRRESERARRK